MRTYEGKRMRWLLSPGSMVRKSIDGVSEADATRIVVLIQGPWQRGVGKGWTQPVSEDDSEAGEGQEKCWKGIDASCCYG